MKSILCYTSTLTFLFSLVFTSPIDINDKLYQFELNKKEIYSHNGSNYDELSEKELYNNKISKKTNVSSLPDAGIETKSRPVCEDCEFNWSQYGSMCCDTAWDDFGLDCAFLETTYNWDCAGCLCPGDVSDPECGDGACNGNETYETCPNDCDEPVCGDSICNGDETYETCPNDCNAPGECNDGFIPDCADDDCVPEEWITDGYCDGIEQQYGANLCCFDNDGGDCSDEQCAEPECGDSVCNGSENYETCPDDCDEPFCGDGICNGQETSETCPVDCDEPGTDCFETWIGDGYCDTSNNSEQCQWDGGDCCGSTCTNASYDCNSSSTGPCVNECLDPSANDECCADNTCPFTCEGNGLVTCWDSSCAESQDDCPAVTCSDTECSFYLSSYTCPQIEENYGYDCSVCEEEGVCPITCEDEGLITCFSGECAISEEDCNGCENPIAAIEGINYSEGYDEFYHFDTDGEAGFLTLSTSGSGVDTKLYLYALCNDVDIDNYPYGDYIAYNDDWGTSQYGVCPDCGYSLESYIYIGIPAGEYIIVSSDQYNSSNAPFEWSLAFDLGIEGCTNASANNYNPEANIDDGTCEFDDGVFFVTCDGGSYQSEVSWELINNETGNIVLNGGAPYEGIVAIDEGDYVLNAMDSWGDGWNGNIWTLFDAESNEIFSYTFDTGTGGLSEVFTIEGASCYPGDLNNDDIINILDVLALVNAILVDEFNDEIQSCGDMNNDVTINILDILAIVNIILS
jgi:hypothetical protein